MGFKHFVFNVLLLVVIINVNLGCKKDSFHWNLISAPEISSITISDNNLDDFTVESTCKSDGNDNSTISGFYWATHQNPSVSDSIVYLQNGEGSFSKKMQWTKSSIIYIRAFSKNSITTSLSDVQKITWSGNQENKQTLSIKNVLVTSFTSINVEGVIDNTQGYEIQESGFCISEQQIPTIDNSIRIEKSSLVNNSLKLDINNLIDGKKFYVSFYTKTIVGYSYSSPSIFKIPKLYRIGDIGPTGGFVFYQRQTFSLDWNFLEVANKDVSSQYPWGLNLTKTSIVSKEAEMGYSNTLSMLSTFGNSGNYSALVSHDFVLNNYNDWFLPSIAELSLIRDLFLIKPSLNLVDEIYWSSTEDQNFSERAWAVRMIPDTQMGSKVFTQLKTSNEFIRPIRRF